MANRLSAGQFQDSAWVYQSIAWFERPDVLEGGSVDSGSLARRRRDQHRDLQVSGRRDDGLSGSTDRIDRRGAIDATEVHTRRRGRLRIHKHIENARVGLLGVGRGENGWPGLEKLDARSNRSGSG